MAKSVDVMPVSAGQPHPDRAVTNGLLLGRVSQPPSYAVHRPGGADSWLLLVTEHGTGRARFAHNDTRLTRGSVALLPPDIEHRYGTADAPRWDFWWAHFRSRPHWAALLPSGALHDGVVGTGLDEAVTLSLLDGFARLHAAARWPGYGGVPHSRPVEPVVDVSLAASEAGWRLAAPEIERLLVLTCAASEQPIRIRDDDRIQRLLALVAAEPAKPHTLTTLASSVGLSPSRLGHLATDRLGRPLMGEIRRIRLDHAARLLTGTDLGVAQVARASGFTSPFHFSRRFHAEYGSSPSDYRRRALP